MKDTMSSPDCLRSIAVLLPCYNEALTIGDVVHRFRATLPDATIYVYDNNSSDQTSLVAAAAGAIVVRERRQGKGHVVRQMFADIDAAVYVLADGDGTNPPEAADQLVRLLVTENLDMVVGTRRNVKVDAGREGHALGNKLFNLLYNHIFGRDFSDIFSGYRVFSRRFVKSFPALSEGFEIETEMSVHASRLMLPVMEFEVDYGRRPEGSHSKLSTYKDGFRILWMFGKLMKSTRPFLLFGIFGMLLSVLGSFLLAPVASEYVSSGTVARQPTLVLGKTLMVVSLLSFVTGAILQSVAKARIEQLRLIYVSAQA